MSKILDKILGRKSNAVKSECVDIDPNVVNYNATNGDDYVKMFRDYWRDHDKIRFSDGIYAINGGTKLISSAAIKANIKFETDIEKDLFIINVPDSLVLLRSHSCKKFPFRMGTVNGFGLDMPELQSLEHCPVHVPGTFWLCDVGAANKHITSMIGCPQKVGVMHFVMEKVMDNMANSLVHEANVVIIRAPGMLSFEGNTAPIRNLELDLFHQSSITGINKLKNVRNLTLVLNVGVFEGGLLDIMRIKGLERVHGGLDKSSNKMTGSPRRDSTGAMTGITKSPTGIGGLPISSGGIGSVVGGGVGTMAGSAARPVGSHLGGMMKVLGSWPMAGSPTTMPRREVVVEPPPPMRAHSLPPMPHGLNPLLNLPTEIDLAIQIIDRCLIEKINIHDAQEMLIDAGFEKFATI